MGRGLAPLLLAGLLGCSELPILPRPLEQGEQPRLSELGFFSGDLATLEPAARVFPYEVRAELWADFAEKERFLFVPEGLTVDFDDGEGWGFPSGSVVIKSFGFPLDRADEAAGRRLIETRLLTREDDGWSAALYLWNDEQSDAVRFVGGTRLPVSYRDEDGATQNHEYVVPNTNQCGNCHARDDRLELLGVITPQMNRTVAREGETVEQLAWLAEQGVFTGAPPAAARLAAFEDPFGAGALDRRARSWLHANCSHCHRPGGAGGASGLVLLEWQSNPLELGICKSTAAAGSGTGGFEFDVVPGAPDESIMPFRISSTDPAIKMPEIPNRIPDAGGLGLVKEWIASLEPAGCP